MIHDGKAIGQYILTEGRWVLVATINAKQITLDPVPSAPKKAYVDRGCFATKEDGTRCGAPRYDKSATGSILCSEHNTLMPRHPLHHGYGRWNWCIQGDGCSRWAACPDGSEWQNCAKHGGADFFHGSPAEAEIAYDQEQEAKRLAASPSAGIPASETTALGAGSHASISESLSLNMTQLTAGVSAPTLPAYVDRGCFATKEDGTRCGNKRMSNEPLCRDCERKSREQGHSAHPLLHGRGRWGWCVGGACDRWSVWPEYRQRPFCSLHGGLDFLCGSARDAEAAYQAVKAYQEEQRGGTIINQRAIVIQPQYSNVTISADTGGCIGGAGGGSASDSVSVVTGCGGAGLPKCILPACDEPLQRDPDPTREQYLSMYCPGHEADRLLGELPKQIASATKRPASVDFFASCCGNPLQVSGALVSHIVCECGVRLRVSVTPNEEGTAFRATTEEMTFRIPAKEEETSSGD